MFKSLLIVFLLVASSSATKYTHLLWERQISKALNERDDYFQRVGVAHTEAAYSLFWTQKGSETLRKQLEVNTNPGNPWYHLLSGVVFSNTSLEQATNHFYYALGSAKHDPGALWVLFCEFRLTKQVNWAEKCLKDLEKELYISGALAAPVIAQQLINAAREEYLLGNNANAEKYLAWSSLFERYPVWQTFLSGWHRALSEPMVLTQACLDCIVIVAKSWFLQLTVLYYWYQWLRMALGILIIGIIAVLSLEYLPTALHPLTSVYPSGISGRLRYLFCLMLYLSFSIFGIIPFLLLTSILIWPLVQERAKKTLLFGSMVMLFLTPVDARIQQVFISSLSPDSTPGLFRRVTNEGWHADLELAVSENCVHHPEDFLAHGSAAILALKKNDYAQALSHVQTALRIKPDDPVLLTTAGNIYYASGQSSSALQYYEKCVLSNPGNAAVTFNLGQLNLMLMNTTEGTQQLSKAAELDADQINGFISKNALYFSAAWPKLRQFIQPDYTIDYFWKHIFSKYNGNWKSTATLWGASFLGIQPLVFLIISPLLLIVILGRKKSSPLEKIFFCKLCGQPMCRRCRIGPLCTDCSHATEPTLSGSAEINKKLVILRRKKLNAVFINALLTLVFPGAWGIYQKKTIPLSSMLMLMTTASIYAAYLFILTVTFAYPFWVIKNAIFWIAALLTLYNIYFAIQSVRLFIKQLKNLEVGIGS